MSNLTRIPTELGSFITSIVNPEEQQTAIEVLTKLLPTLERKRHANEDNLLIAAGLYEVREKHGYKSESYQNILEGIAKLDEAWADKHYRSEWLDAYNGYRCLPGSDKDKACILKMNPSRSALAAVRLIPNHKVYSFFAEIKGDKTFPTAAAVERFAKQGRLTSSSSSTTKTEPQVNKVEQTAAEAAPTDNSPTSTIIDVEAAPVVEKEIPTTQELEQLESANVETDVAPVVEDVTSVQSVSDERFVYATNIDRMNKELWELNKVISSATPEQKKAAATAAGLHLKAAERLHAMLSQFASV